MTPAQWKRVKQILPQAAKLDGPAREKYLRALGKKNQAVRREVESLLRHHNKRGDLLDVPASLAVGDVLSHYVIGKQIGKGGMGEVFHAQDTLLERVVALKFPPPWAVSHPPRRQRLIREAQYASALNHPNIVTVHGFDRDRGVDFIVMEYVPGKTLESVIPARGLQVDTALRYAVQMADALAAAHAKGILHGDVKPPNIMLTDDGRIKLLDFGLARALATGASAASEARPSVYMAPEQLEDIRRGPDASSEIFSFGLILHQVLSGKHPFKRSTREEMLLAIRTRKPRPLPSKVPASLAGFTFRCLEKDPAQRPASMGEVFIELKKCRATVSGPDQAAEIVIPSVEIKQMRTIVRRIGYDSVARSRGVLTEIERLVKKASPEVREAAASALRDVILSVDQDNNGVPGSAREVRRLTLDALRASAPGGVAEFFKNGELEHLDLYGMNFAGERLAGVSFKACFLVAANFLGCDLSAATFAGTWIRNVNFTNADLSDADMTDADWFNALGLTESQLRSVLPQTLLDCPPDISAMHGYLAAHYGVLFESWPTQIQKELQAAWTEYLRPGGLRDVVADLRRTDQ